MRFSGVTLLAMALVSCGGKPGGQMEVKGDTAIVGGTLVPENAPLAQSIVGIYDGLNQAICTGSLIGEGIVLTAAHCVFDSKPQKMKIIFATDIMAVMGTSEPDIKAELMRDVSEFKYHEMYNPEEQETNEFDWSDIAIIKFKGTTPSGYKPVEILPDGKSLKVGMTAIMAGYGVEKVATYPVEARKVKNLKEAIANGEVICDDDMKDCEEVSMSGDGELRETYATVAHIVRSEIRLDESHGRSSCSGDSGGPLYLQQNDKTYLIGVTSRGSQLCDRVGIYTSTTYYRDWISYNIKQIQ